MQTRAEILTKKSPESLDEAQKIIAALLQYSQKLEFRVNYLERYHLGRRSEKFIDPNQPSLGFDEVESYEDEIDDSPEEESSERSTTPTKKKRRPQLEIPASIKRVEIPHEIPDEDRKCECCGTTKAEIGEERSEKLHIVPATILCHVHIFKKYACQNKSCDSAPVQAPRPPAAIPKIKATEEMLAFIAEQKYSYGLPLYRIERMFAEDGCEVSRYVMSQWMIKLAEVLKPLYNHMKQRLADSGYVHMDETVLQVLREKDRPATSESRMWVMCSDTRSTSPPIAIYHYSPTRKAEVITELLGSWFRGYLQSDDYAGYSSYADHHSDVIHALCWDHARRHFWDAYQAIPKAKRANSLAERVIKLIGKLYKVEERIKGKTENEILQARTEESKVYLKKIKDLVESKIAALSESSPTYKAINYTLSNWEKLTLYIQHPRLNISNNPAEQCIRPFALGRKAWLFSNTPRGAEASAIIYSIVETAKMNQKIPGEVISSMLKVIPHEGPSKLLEIITGSTST